MLGIEHTYTDKNSFLSAPPGRSIERSKRGGGPLGLSNGHNRPHNSLSVYNQHNINKLDATVRYYPEGQSIEIKTPWMNKTARKEQEKKRGIIQYLSSKSRARLRVKLSRLKKTELPLFVTLTYPKKYPDIKGAKRDLKVFIQRLKRKYEKLGYIWRLERQSRGAPHFHLFIWGASYHEMIKYVSQIWYEVCGSGDSQHLCAGTNVERIREKNGIIFYVSKYLSKMDNKEKIEDCGRIWGYGGEIPFADCIEYKITRQQAYKLLRYLRRRIKYVSNYGLRNFIINYPERWLSNHEELTEDRVPF